MLLFKFLKQRQDTISKNLQKQVLCNIVKSEQVVWHSCYYLSALLLRIMFHSKAIEQSKANCLQT